jgi:uncharacterized protein (DUF779 family)
MTLDRIAGHPVVASITIAGEASPRVELSPAASSLLAKLWVQHGPLMFHQSGGCCDGSAPMCYPAGEFVTSAADGFAVEAPEGVRFLIRSRLMEDETPA